MIVRLQDVVNRINGNVDRFNTNIKYYIGKGHGECGEIAITEHGDLEADVNTLGFKFHFAFQPGDTLFFSRSFALRKAGMAMFEGLCSDSTYILRTKNENILLGEYLPAILQSDVFWQFCDTHHTGGVNFLINWSTLAAYEFDLPPIEEQRVLAEKLWAAYRLKEAYRRLLAATQEMVKSQFIEMLTPLWDAQKTIPLDSMIQEDSPITYGILMPGHHVEDGVPVVKVKDMVEGKITMDDMLKTSKEIDEQYKRSRLRENDVLLSIRGTIGRVAVIPQELNGANITQDTARLRLKPQYDPFVLKYVLESPIMQFEMEQNKRGATIKGINIGYVREMPIPWPESKEQVRLKAIASQSDKSGFELRKAIEAIDGVIKSLINNKTEA